MWYRLFSSIGDVILDASGINEARLFDIAPLPPGNAALQMFRLMYENRFGYVFVESVHLRKLRNTGNCQYNEVPLTGNRLRNKRQNKGKK